MMSSQLAKLAPATLPFVEPSANSTTAFLAVIGYVTLSFLAASIFSLPAGNRLNISLGRTIGGLLVWLTGSYLGAQTGFFASLTGSLRMGAILMVFNAITLVLALGPLGRRFAERLPIAALVGFQVFRLPLELVLHSWFEQGSLPIQMTYSGVNFDIATGIVALGLAPIISRFSPRCQRAIVAIYSMVGLGLLLNVMSIAVRSAPWPLRTFLNEPPVLLLFHAPFIWILPVCVCGALFAHVVTIRWLLIQGRREQF